MKIKLAEVKSRHQALCMLGNKKLPIKLSYAIGKNIIKLQEELDSIEKARIKLVEQYAEKDEDGNFKMKDGRYEIGEHEQKIKKEFVEFLNTETDVTIYTIPEEIVESMDDVRYDVLTPTDLITLDFMLERPEESVLEEIEPKA